MMLHDVPVPRAAFHMHIYLRCGDAFVAQHILHHPQVSTVLNKMGRKGMTEGKGNGFPIVIVQKMLYIFLLYALCLGDGSNDFPVVIIKSNMFRKTFS